MLRVCWMIGEVLGILGPSGGGKTTLLNMIAQRSRFGWQTGDILYNGMKQNGEQVRIVDIPVFCFWHCHLS